VTPECIGRRTAMAALLSFSPKAFTAASSSQVVRTSLVSDVTWTELERMLAGRKVGQPLEQKSIDERVVSFSAELLGRPFALGPTGEGLKAPLGLPILTLERFDCLTFVETVIALALASNAANAVDWIKVLRYGRRDLVFSTRNHFAGVDWIPSAIRHGLLQYSALAQPQSKSFIKIRRAEWCDRLLRNPMYGAALSGDATGFASITRNCKNSALTDSYEFMFVPFHLLDKSRHLESGRVLVVLRPGSPHNSYAGGGDHVAHMGIAVEQNGRWMFRAASQRKRRVVDVEFDSLLTSSRVNGEGYGLGIFKVTLPRSGQLAVSR
jgi:hypothetical protein